MRGRTLLIAVSTLIVGFVLGSVVPSFAAEAFHGYPTVAVTLNGKAITSDVPAFVIDGRTVLPVRALSEALGLDVKFDAGTQTVALTTKQSSEPITFSNLSTAKSSIGTKVIGEATNVSDKTLRCSIVVGFYGADGKLLARMVSSIQSLAPGQTKTFETTNADDKAIAGYSTVKAELDYYHEP